MPFNFIAKYANYTGVSEPATGFTFTLSPNPATDKIKFKSNSNSNNIVEYKIYDTLGRMVKNGTIKSSSIEINVSRLQSGIYFLNLQTTKGACTRKFVKE